MTGETKKWLVITGHWPLFGMLPLFFKSYTLLGLIYLQIRSSKCKPLGKRAKTDRNSSNEQNIHTAR